MPDFKKSKFSSSRPTTPKSFSRNGPSRPSFGGGAPRYGSRDSHSPSESFKTQCSKCNKECEVPFKPNGRKPVFCRDCFVRDDAPRSRDTGFEKSSFGSERNSDRSYAPSPARTSSAIEDPRIGTIQKELATVHAKLDMLIGTLQGAAYSSILNTSMSRTNNSDEPEEKIPAKTSGKVSTGKKTPKKAMNKKK